MIVLADVKLVRVAVLTHPHPLWLARNREKEKLRFRISSGFVKKIIGYWSLEEKILMILTFFIPRGRMFLNCNKLALGSMLLLRSPKSVSIISTTHDKKYIKDNVFDRLLLIAVWKGLTTTNMRLRQRKESEYWWYWRHLLFAVVVLKWTSDEETVMFVVCR